MVNGPLQKQRWVFFNHNHCLLRECVCVHLNSSTIPLLKFTNGCIYEYIYKHWYVCSSSSTAADSRQHASPQQVRHTLGYIRVFHPRRKRARVRARDSRLRHCQLSRATVHRVVYRVNRHTIDCYKIGERDFDAFLWCVSDDSNVKHCKYKKHRLAPLCGFTFIYVRNDKS